MFREEGPLYTTCLFSIPTIYPKCLLFHFFSRGIRMYIPNLTGVQNGHIGHLKDSVFLQKNVFLKVLFRDEGHLHANCLFSMLTIYPKCHRLRSFSRSIHMYIPNLTGVQNGHIS